jgi:hypothetical protein
VEKKFDEESDCSKSCESSCDGNSSCGTDSELEEDIIPVAINEIPSSSRPSAQNTHQTSEVENNQNKAGGPINNGEAESDI